MNVKKWSSFSGEIFILLFSTKGTVEPLPWSRIDDVDVDVDDVVVDVDVDR